MLMPERNLSSRRATRETVASSAWLAATSQRSASSSLHSRSTVDFPASTASRSASTSSCSCATRSSRRVVEGIPLPGFATRIVLEDAGFASYGDAFLFGCAIDALFASEAPLNLFSELRIELHPSTREITWTPMTGTQPLL